MDNRSSYYYDIWVKQEAKECAQRQGVIKANDVAEAMTNIEKFMSAWGAKVLNAKIYLVDNEGEMDLQLQTTSSAKEPEEVSHSVTKRANPWNFGTVLRVQSFATMRLEESK